MKFVNPIKNFNYKRLTEELVFLKEEFTKRNDDDSIPYDLILDTISYVFQKQRMKSCLVYKGIKYDNIHFVLNNLVENHKITIEKDGCRLLV